MGGALLVASPGGHLDELYELAPRLLDGDGERLWVTAATPHTTCVLAGERTVWVPPVGSRQLGRALVSMPRAVALLRRYRPRLVVSTGAALAAPYLVAARALGVETHYIESATRLDGPSLTGRIVARVPGTRLHHQSFRRPAPRWHHVGSVFDAFLPGPSVDRPVRRAVLILGTERHPLHRALSMVRQAFAPEVEVLVQTGHTPVRIPPAAYRQWIPYDELVGEVERADLVITHAGVGSVLSVLRAGKHPVVIPRRADLGEHVDDHQSELADMLSARGLVTLAPADGNLTPVLAQAARRSTVRAPGPRGRRRS